ncbi:hypothetical protein [Ruminococcus sp.]|uniref:hypothetical protein n=1 Tax=Ruminococcus sp. TaxID=41978 RepID=UPI002BFE7B89|nr:hypothetical protein [Ruminococcus sp.]HNZ99512.1 hypothetical protein [Ruminococcus sp.]HOH86230.1 hypothetical protein [Ruminococcus sp.]
MTVCRIPDTESFSDRYQRVLRTKGIMLAILIAGAAILGFSISQADTSVMLLLIVVYLVITGIAAYLWILYGRNSMAAYIITGDTVCHVDMMKAFTNGPLFGKPQSWDSMKGNFSSLKMLDNMKEISSPAEADMFICRQDVTDRYGSIIKQVYSVTDGERCLRARVQTAPVHIGGGSPKNMTLYIPKDFKDIDILRSELERLANKTTA